MTNILRNKLPRLALLLAVMGHTAGFDARAAVAGLAAQAEDFAQVAAAVMKQAAPIEADETAAAATEEAANYAAAPALEDAPVAASKAAPAEAGSAAEDRAREATAIQCASAKLPAAIGAQSTA